ncbi:bifunctional diguanylate cyclase/phosphodiesterase [Noviherbaspirillum pedocola]|uniref:EAL domain-containing protein n=1 Tax=Noviherbaspirillum pedocola TaxID=2801341 RepID=A0A934W979_9BURK|nr:EAL domain-containing protein [Noviherbaspirillum pedocola]MBK4737743.1 EAL domain-containing protein [Noviherbaspirillum pedocola]
MHKPISPQAAFRPSGVFAFLRRNRGIAAAALAIWLLGSGLLGTWVWSTIRRETDALDREMRAAAVAQVHSFADQLERSLQQIDYIMLSLKHYWQETGHKLDLEEQVRSGLVPASSGLLLTIVDRNGKPVTSTMPLPRPAANIADRDYFREHQAHAAGELLISGPVPGLRTGTAKLILSRRLDAADGSFDGLVIIALDPAYLMASRNESLMLADDFLSVRKSDGQFIAARTRAHHGADLPMSDAYPKLRADHGVGLGRAEQFLDRKPRIVAWQKGREYPVIAMAGLSVQERIAAYAPRKEELLLIGASGSASLLLLCASGLGLALWRRRRAEFVAEVQDAYRIATEGAQERFYMLRPVFGPGGRIEDLIIEDGNRHAAEALGLERHALIGTRFSSHFQGTLPLLLPGYQLAAETGHVEDEVRLPGEDARTPQWLQRRIVLSGSGFAVTVRDVTAARMHEESLQRLANTDTLTGLPNRHWLTDYLPLAVERARGAGTRLAVIFVDLDDFKNLNDTLGHAAGDELLRAAAGRLKAMLRPGDNIARLGGDEFTMLLEPVAGVEEAGAVAGRIVATLQESFMIGDGHPHQVHASIGISLYPRDGSDGETLLKNADIAMYAAKAAGKGSYRFFTPELAERLVDRITRSANLKHAIEHRELVLYYQPRVCGKTGALTSFEALVRWMHPSRGLVGPDNFIPMAEETGLIVALGEQVIDLACAQLAQWREHGLPLLPVSVNASARQINEGGLSAALAAALQRHGVDAALLEVEITESATVAESRIATEEIAALQRLGVRLYVDDFGTGYSSLSQLRRLDLFGLKVDRSFTARLLHSDEDHELFRAIVSMAHAIGMQVVAEGVESREQLQSLIALDCDQMQGYFLGKPAPAEQMPALMEKAVPFTPG